MNKKNSISLMHKMLVPMVCLVLLQISIAAVAFVLTGVGSTLNQKSFDSFDQKVLARKNYIEYEMKARWSKIDSVASAVNTKVAQYLSDNNYTYQDLEAHAEAYGPLLLDLSENIIDMMRTNTVTGGFIVFNSSDLSIDRHNTTLENKPGLYIRDLDPTGEPSNQNSDLLLKRAPIAVVKGLNISTDTDWKPQFSFQTLHTDYYDFLYEPYQMALKRPDLNYKHLDYWSSAYTLTDDSKSAISYSIPLILEDGSVYGVMGVDLTLDYLSELLPYEELVENKQCSYILASANDTGNIFYNSIISGPLYSQLAQNKAYTYISDEQIYGDNYRIFSNNRTEDMFCNIQSINLYEEGSPFPNNWTLLGIGIDSDLLSYSTYLTRALIIVGSIILLVGIVGVAVISYSIAAPVGLLVKQMYKTNSNSPITLDRVNIQEIDKLADAIESSSKEIFETSRKFSHIVNMANIKIAVYEINTATNTLFVSDNFFNVLQIKNVTLQGITVSEFQNLLEGLQPLVVQNLSTPNDKTLCIPTSDGKELWIRIKVITNGNKIMGLAEDITSQTLEMKKLERERDFDPLTNTLNRRSFIRKLEYLFTIDKSILNNAVMLMLDIDNLKYINDTYGHDYGDIYIASTAKALQEGTKNARALLARISGDEFYIFIYGYNNRDDIYKYIRNIRDSIEDSTVLLPNNENYRIRVSGGMAWYPDDSIHYEALMRYADFAMYKIKHTTKGQFSEFDKAIYNKEYYLLSGKEELNRLIEGQLVEYHFQPIVDAHNGIIHGYEALMRSKIDGLKNPSEIIRLAESESKLYQIESLTWFNSLKAYSQQVENRNIPIGTKVFINSIPNQLITTEEVNLLIEMYADYLPYVVMEITENESITKESIDVKLHYNKLYNSSVAIDDYGSGYNSESMLLKLTPEYVKIDMALVRDIHCDVSKQKIVYNLLSYSHERNIKVIAEGVETYQEMEQLITMGVDLLQGYYFAKPALLPPLIKEEVVNEIRSIYKRFMH